MQPNLETWSRLSLYATGVIVLIVMKRISLNKGFIIIKKGKARSFSTCGSSVSVTTGEKSYLVSGWVSNYNPWVLSEITIGSFCSINSVSFVLNGDAGHTHGILCSTYQWDGVRRQKDRRSSITIGNDVWIGQDVMILGGVTIGDGAIVGAGSLVTRDVAPYTIVAGNPANIIRTRYTEDQIKKLLRLKWWNIENIEEFANEFEDLNVEQQIRMLRRIRRRRKGWIQ